MREYELTKQAIKKLKNLSKNDPKIATQIASSILNLRKDLIKGESLTGFTLYKKIRVRNFRIIYKLENEKLLIAIIDKRETVYKIFEHLVKNSYLF